MRLFVAILLSDDMKDSLLDAQNRLFDRGVRGRFTTEENMHLTLAFIGEVPDAEPALDALATVSFTPFVLSLEGMGRFGDLWWAGLRDSATLTALVRRLRRALTENGVPFDRKRFSPHITLLRKARGEMPGIPVMTASMTVERVSLMRSDRGKNGMIYTEIGVCEAQRPREKEGVAGDLFQYDGKPVRLTTVDGEVFEGRPEHFPCGYGRHEFDREEESLRFGIYMVFESEIRSVEPLDPARLCGFYGAEFVPEGVRQLYRDLRHVWCAETCAPGMRDRWSSENPSFGQCSITAFLVQEMFGGTVYGFSQPDGSIHCYNEIGDATFDLTSEQLKDVEPEQYFDLENREQRREDHFARLEKRERYELLKRRLSEYREAQDR